jgi:hypothetical protein|tara:strand:+ start:1358 stop:1564 length:207 start_codon:yes stop_codon:yes gene_type:complete
MTTVTTDPINTLEDAKNLIAQLCEVVVECYDTISQIDNELENDDVEEAILIIDRFFETSQQHENTKLH